MEVGASDSWVGSIFSQWQGKTSNVYPCALFYGKLTPLERNYNVENQELLAIKIALEEWQIWLEGSKFPFVFLTDHKNPEYVKSTKWLKQVSTFL